MTDQNQQPSPEDEKTKRLKRAIAIVVIGTVSVVIFQYFVQSLVELYVATGEVTPVE